MYVPLPPNRQYTEVLLRLADGAPMPITGLRHAVARIDSAVPLDDGPETAAESLHGFLGLPRFRAALFGVFAVLAVTLVGAGLLAVVFRSVKERTREIGIRLALGARPWQVKREMLVEGLRPVVIGLSLGLVSAAGLTRLLSAFLPHVSPTDTLVFVSSAALLLVVALAAIWAPVHRAAHVDPAGILRGH
jgi:ABC-type antimicrobial peptide transport system permease subunit